VAPARLLRLPKGTLTVGADADVTVLDPDCQWVFEKSGSASKAFNSPFYGWPLRGKAVARLDESVLCQDSADIAAREDTEFSHAPRPAA